MNRTDRHDINPYELKLIRAGHHLWRLRRQKSLSVGERRAIHEALETVWNAKKELRAELALIRKERGKALAERMKGFSGSASLSGRLPDAGNRLQIAGVRAS